MSLGARVQSLENMVGRLNKSMDDIKLMLEEYFGVRRTGQDRFTDPVLRTYTLLRAYLDAEKRSQQELTHLLTHADHYGTAGLLGEFLRNLPEDEQKIVAELQRQGPALTEFVRESALFEELRKARNALVEQSKPVDSDTSHGVLPEAVIPVPDADTEMSGVEEKITTTQAQVPKDSSKDKVNKKKKRSASKAPQASAPSERMKAKPSKSKDFWTEQTPLESLLRAAGVRFTPAALSDAEHKLAIAKQLPDRELTEEQRKLIFAKMDQA